MRVCLVVVLAAACGGPAGLPPPPEYKPVASPEPKTQCPDERTKAKAEREALLELATPEARQATVRAVMAHAECEARGFDRADIVAPTQVAMIERIRQARQRYQDARNLYDEVGNYEVLEQTIGSRSRLGDLHSTFANKLRSAAAPADLRDPTERASFLKELGDYAQAYDAEAAAAYRECLDTAGLLPSLRGKPEVATWVGAACRGLDRLGAVGTRSTLCGGGQ